MLLALLFACSTPSDTLACDDGSYTFHVRDVGPGISYTVDWSDVTQDDDVGDVFDVTADVYVTVTRLLVPAEDFHAALCNGDPTTDMQGSSVSAEAPEASVPEAVADVPANEGDALLTTLSYNDNELVTLGLFRVGASGDTVLVLDDESFSR